MKLLKIIPHCSLNLYDETLEIHDQTPDRKSLLLTFFSSSFHKTFVYPRRIPFGITPRSPHTQLNSPIKYTPAPCLVS